jgi:hypothetical protein
LFAFAVALNLASDLATQTVIVLSQRTVLFFFNPSDMPIVPISPGVSTRTRSKSAWKTKIDTESTTVAKASTAQWVHKEKAEKSPSKKRKRDTGLLANRKVVSIPQANNEEEVVSPLKKKTKTANRPEKDEIEEKRLRLFRQKAPQSYLVRLSRATSQRYGTY